MAWTKVDAATHVPEHLGERNIALERIAPEAVDTNPTSGDRSCGQKVRRSRGIWFDAVVGADVATTNAPDSITVVVDLCAERAHDCAGHLDVGPRNRFGSEGHPHRRRPTGEQKAGDELA